MSDEIILWGGIGEKKSNGGRQWYRNYRIYDSNGLSPALSQLYFWIVIKKEKDDVEQ